MQLPDSAAGLVNLALKANDPYMAAAVYAIAEDKDKTKLQAMMFSRRRDALALARWEHTPALVLEALASVADEAMVIKLDKNQNTPSEALSKLYVAQGLMSKSRSNMTVLLAQHRHASPAMLKHIAQFEQDEATVLALSKNMAATSEAFAILLDRFANTHILQALQKNISQHPAATIDLLVHLFELPDVRIKAAVIAHDHCPAQLIEAVVYDENVLIQRQLAADKRISHKLMASLALQQDKAVRCRLAANLALSQALIRRLAIDECELVRRLIATRVDLTAATISHLIHDTDVWVRQKLARNPIVASSVLDKLSKDSAVDVRRGVARNASCPLRLLSVLANDDNDWVRSAVAYQGKASKRLLKNLAQDSSLDVLSGVANNPNTPQSILKKLSASAAADVRRGVILNKSATRLTLLALLQDDYYLHRLMLVANHRLPDKDKWPLCLDPDYQVRFTALSYFANRFIKSSA